jgi:hypothetical protein
MRHEKKFEVFARPKYTILHARLLHYSEEFARSTYPCLMPMARHPLRPPLFELWNLVPQMTAAVKQGKNTLSTLALASKIETHIWSCVKAVSNK